MPGGRAASAARDRLDVDRGLAAARHAVQEQRARIALLDRPRDAVHGGRLRLGQLGRPWPTAARPGRSRGEGPARPFPHAGLGEAAPDQARRGSPSRAARPRPPPRRHPPRRTRRPAPRARRPGVDPAAGPAAAPPRPAPPRPHDRPAAGGSSARTVARRPPRATSSRASRGRAPPEREAGGAGPPGHRARRGRGRAVRRRRAGRGGRCRRHPSSPSVGCGVRSATSSRRSSRPGGSIARITRAGGAR